MTRAALASCLLACSVALPAAAQTPAAPAPPAQTPAAAATTVRWYARNWTRVEMWNYFEPNPGGGDPSYAFIANRLQFGMERRAPKYDVTIAGQYVQFGGLPTNASGPGALGTGALYYDHSHDTASHQVYLRYLSIRFKGVSRGLDLAIGRMPYVSGAETPSGTAAIETVKRQRIDSRLIGEFEWSLYQRSFDGGRLDLSRSSWHLTAGAFVPTQGGFEERANESLANVVVLTGVVGFKPGAPLKRTDWQLFAYRYADTRDVRARVDNTGLTATAVDIHINTFGTSLVGVYPSGPGQFDAVLWIAGQNGDWYGQAHRAGAVAAEIGYQWTKPAAKPWIRAGVFRSTGDTDPADARHDTFFQMLPTGRKYSLSTLNALMNITDVFAQVLAKPHPRLSVRGDVHALSLTTAADRWYGGSGATQRSGTIFGYAGRSSKGATGLGTEIDGAVDVSLNRHWSINGYIGWIDGGNVVRRTFAGRTLTYAYVENVVVF